MLGGFDCLVEAGKEDWDGILQSGAVLGSGAQWGGQNEKEDGEHSGLH